MPAAPGRLVLLCLLTGLVPCFASASGAPPQDEHLEKYTRYLERAPYHEAVFQRLVHEAVERGALPELERVYARRLEEDPGDTVARVLLARIHAYSGRSGEGLEALATLGEDTAELANLRARLLLAAGEREQGVRSLQRAAELCTDRLLAVDLWTRLGELRALAGEREAAADALRALADVEPASFTLRLEAAQRMDRHGLHAEALEQLEVALELAGEDPARRVRVHLLRARQHEAASQLDEALAAYAEADALMGPGHWQRAELFERRLLIHLARGSEARLLAELEQESADFAADPERREALVRGLLAAEQDARALEVLARATEDFPDSVALGRLYMDALSEGGRGDEALDTALRLARMHPERLDLRVEAGTRLAAADRRAAARQQWDLALAAAPGDVDLALRIARLQRTFGLEHDAERLLLETLERAPDDLRPYRALAAAWGAGDGASRRSTDLLARLEERAAERGDSATLEELAMEWLGREEREHASRAIASALDAGGERGMLLAQLADLLEESRRPQEALAPLLELLHGAREPRRRSELLQRIVDLADRTQRLRGLVREQESRLEEHPTELATALLVSRAHAHLGDDERAREVLVPLAGEDTAAGDLAWQRAWLAERAGNLDEAAAELRALVHQRPREARRALEELVRLYRKPGREELLAAAYDELLALDPTSRTLILDVAREHRGRKPERAVELYRRALELYPDDDETRLTLAELYLRVDAPEAASEELVRLLASREPELRNKARRLFTQRLTRERDAVMQLERARREYAEHPTRVEHGIAFVLSLLEARDYHRADEVGRELLRRFPRDPALLELHAELYGLTVESLAGRRGTGPARSTAERDLYLAGLLLLQREDDHARTLLRGVADPAQAAGLCLERDRPDIAEELLREALKSTPQAVDLRVRLVVALRVAGRTGQASRALDEAVRESGNAWPLLVSQMRDRLERGRRSAARDSAAELFARLTTTRTAAFKNPLTRQAHERRVMELAELLHDAGLERELRRRGAVLLETTPGDLPLFRVVLGAMDPRFHGAAARGILDLARGDVPTPWSSEEWEEVLGREGARFSR